MASLEYFRAASNKDTPESEPMSGGANAATNQLINSSHIEKSLLASYPGVPTVLDDSQAWTGANPESIPAGIAFEGPVCFLRSVFERFLIRNPRT